MVQVRFEIAPEAARDDGGGIVDRRDQGRSQRMINESISSSVQSV